MQATLPTTSISNLPVELITRILQYAASDHKFVLVVPEPEIPETPEITEEEVLEAVLSNLALAGTLLLQQAGLGATLTFHILELAAPTAKFFISMDDRTVVAFSSPELPTPVTFVNYNVPAEPNSEAGEEDEDFEANSEAGEEDEDFETHAGINYFERCRQQKFLCTTSLIRLFRAPSQALLWSNISLDHESINRGHRLLHSPALRVYATHKLTVERLPREVMGIEVKNRREYFDLIQGLLNNLKDLTSVSLDGVEELEPFLFGIKNLSRISTLELVGHQSDLVSQQLRQWPNPTGADVAFTSPPDLDWAITLPFHLSSFKLTGEIGPNLLTSIIKSSPQLKSLAVVDLERSRSTMTTLIDALTNSPKGLQHLELNNSYEPAWNTVLASLIDLKSLSLTTSAPSTLLATILPLLPGHLKSLSITLRDNSERHASWGSKNLRETMVLFFLSAITLSPLEELKELTISPFLLVDVDGGGRGSSDELRSDLDALLLNCQQRGIVVKNLAGSRLLP
ncbi:hypothetical protein P7C70_g1863, partial [Phenoliferia sp. Uapishka_3]